MLLASLSRHRKNFRKSEKPRRLPKQTTAKARRRIEAKRLCCFLLFRFRSPADRLLMRSLSGLDFIHRNNTLLHGESDQLLHILQIKFTHHVRAVRLDGAHADIELIADITVRFAKSS